MRKILNTDIDKIIKRIKYRDPDANKGSYGKVLIMAGGMGMSGAAFFSSLAAYRTGVGLVRVFTHECNRQIIASLIPEAIVLSYDEKDDIYSLLRENISWSDAVIAGPGLGTSALSVKIIENLLDIEMENKKKGLLLLDADALNIISKREDFKRKLKAHSTSLETIITPHPMEMSRFISKDIADILKNPMPYITSVSKDFDITVLLKGSNSIVYNYKNDILFVNEIKSPALAKAGSGDILCGIIAGVYELIKASKSEDLLALNVFYAAAAGTLIHVRAGNLAAELMGVHSVLARDTANMIGKVIF